jgi:Na+-transporting methylmalonyl-CoA/oxaloacetate decarboxylase beta subunit
MSRINLDDNRTWGLTLGPKTKFANEQFVFTDNAVVAANSPPMIFTNPGGAIDLLMPPSDPATAGAAQRGQIFIFVNLSGSVVTLKTSADAAFATAITVAANGATRVVCTGSTTANLGWVIW